eukprot:6481-Pleurochrysis_carterae.AAC.1
MQCKGTRACAARGRERTLHHGRSAIDRRAKFLLAARARDLVVLRVEADVVLELSLRVSTSTPQRMAPSASAGGECVCVRTAACHLEAPNVCAQACARSDACAPSDACAVACARARVVAFNTPSPLLRTSMVARLYNCLHMCTWHLHSKSHSLQKARRLASCQACVTMYVSARVGAGAWLWVVSNLDFSMEQIHAWAWVLLRGMQRTRALAQEVIEGVCACKRACARVRVRARQARATKRESVNA